MGSLQQQGFHRGFLYQWGCCNNKEEDDPRLVPIKRLQQRHHHHYQQPHSSVVEEIAASIAGSLSWSLRTTGSTPDGTLAALKRMNARLCCDSSCHHRSCSSTTTSIIWTDDGATSSCSGSGNERVRLYCRAMVAVDGHRAVLDAMQCYPHHFGIQFECCKSLAYITCYGVDDDHRTTTSSSSMVVGTDLLKAGGLEMIVRAMNESLLRDDGGSNSDDPRIQVWGAGIIGRLVASCSHSAAKLRALECDAPKTIVTAMTVHVEHAGVQHSSAVALERLLLLEPTIAPSQHRQKCRQRSWQDTSPALALVVDTKMANAIMEANGLAVVLASSCYHRNITKLRRIIELLGAAFEQQERGSQQYPLLGQLPIALN